MPPKAFFGRQIDGNISFRPCVHAVKYGQRPSAILARLAASDGRRHFFVCALSDWQPPPPPPHKVLCTVAGLHGSRRGLTNSAVAQHYWRERRRERTGSERRSVFFNMTGDCGGIGAEFCCRSCTFHIQTNQKVPAEKDPFVTVAPKSPCSSSLLGPSFRDRS